MNWLFFATGAYLIYSATNFIDKYLVEKRVKDPISLITIDGALYFVLGILFFIFGGSHFIPLVQALLLILSGSFLTFYLLPYFQALQREDTSRVVPLFQFYPIWTLLLSFLFLHETLTQNQLLGFAIVVAGGFLLGLEDFSLKTLQLRKAFFLMLFSSFLYALSNIIFKFVTINNFWTNFSYITVGSAIGSLLLLYKKHNRSVLKEQLKVLTLGTGIIFLVNSLLNLLAELLAFFALSLGPVALVSAVNGIQPFIIFVYGFILTLLFPKIIKEDISKKTILLKIAVAIVLGFGIYIIYT